MYSIRNLNKITTYNPLGPNGIIVPIFKDYEDKYMEDIKYIYMTTINSSSYKGPKLHLKRSCNLFPIIGYGSIYLKNESDAVEIEFNTSTDEYYKLITIYPGTAFKIFNKSNETLHILNIANHAWDKYDQDNIDINMDWWNYGIGSKYS